MSISKPTIETKSAYITKIDEDVVRVEIKKNYEITLSDLEENYNAYKQLFGDDMKLYILSVFNEGASTSLEVRNKFVSKERSAFKIAEAIVINSMAHRIVGNFVIKVQKPKHKMQAFGKEKEAMDWLLNERLKNNYKQL